MATTETTSSKKKKKKKTRRGSKAKKATLTTACAALQKELVDDLRTVLADPADASHLERFQAEHAEAKKQARTGHAWSEWLTGRLDQIAASWVLAMVFVRYCEDTKLIDPAIAGPLDENPARDRRRLAEEVRDRYYAKNPTHATPDYLQHVFETCSKLPGLDGVMGRGHAMLWQLTPSNDGADAILAFAREIDEDTAQTKWRFDQRGEADSNGPDTRFLGDLYQDLSDHARENFALLQTPEFVEEFILDRTLAPAMATFAEDLRRGEFRMIDPTVGSAHFLLGGFQRLLRYWQTEHPGLDPKEHAQKALDGVWGCDINPFAAAIARFRLLVAALDAAGITRLDRAPDFKVHIAVGDALLHGPRFTGYQGVQGSFDPEHLSQHVYGHEDRHDILEVLGQQYHAVVGNPPYITPKDKAMNAAYRERYASCHGKYSLAVPFMERFVELAVRGEDGTPAGYVGKITGNAFMKREFGSELIEKFFPRWDLTTVVDTSGAYIPGHGTPTVVLFFRNQKPVSQSVRAALGIRGEPSTPEDPAQGLVWRSTVDQLDQPGSENEYISVEDKDRAIFAKHPWSLAGGGAGELKARLEAAAVNRLDDVVAEIGVAVVTGEDDVYTAPATAPLIRRIDRARIRGFVEGDVVRDWGLRPELEMIWPLDLDSELILPDCSDVHFWISRTLLSQRIWFKKIPRERAHAFFEPAFIASAKLRTPRSIAFAEIATHNHFVFDRGGKVFKQTAPVIKLPPDATDEDHFELLGVLNSSVAAFWLKQVCTPKGGDHVGTEGARVTRTKWDERYAFNSSNIAEFPLVESTHPSRAETLDAVLRGRADLVGRIAHAGTADSSQGEEWRAALRRAIFMQEELDWACYDSYALTEDCLLATPGLAEVELELGQRAFEIVLARRIEQGSPGAEWFERHGSTPITEIPGHWPNDYRDLVQRRIDLIESDRSIRLLEQPEHKRRWNLESWEDQVERSVRTALLDHIEALPRWKAEPATPCTTNQLADELGSDARFLELLRLYTGEDAPNVARVLKSLVADAAVPFLPVMYLKDSGLRKRADWEGTWELQRLEDPFIAKQEAMLDAFFGSSPAEQRRGREHVACWLTSNKLTKEKLDDLSAEERVAHEKALAELREQWRAVDAERQAVVGGVTPPVPPKYGSGDFKKSTWWRHRGKLDVPKERFILYPDLGPETDDSPLVGWAGWDHRQQAEALYMVADARAKEGWSPDRRMSAYRGIAELVPWLAQWHDQEQDYSGAYAGLVEGFLTEASETRDALMTWRPA